MPTAHQFQAIDTFDQTATIASGQTTSAEIDLGGGVTLAGLIMPSSFTGTSIKIQMANASGGTYVTVQSLGSDYQLTVAGGKYVPIENLAITAALRWIKLVSGSSEAADRTIILATRPV